MGVKIIKSGIIIMLFIVTGVTLYWWNNPSIDNKDFHLEYEVSNNNMDFYSARNKKIGKDKFTYNDQRYCNEIDEYKLVIHSLDFENNIEKIIIVIEYLDENIKHRTANVTYKNKDGKFSPIQIKNKKDSIFVIQNLEYLEHPSRNIIFEGKEMVGVECS